LISNLTIIVPVQLWHLDLMGCMNWAINERNYGKKMPNYFQTKLIKTTPNGSKMSSKLQNKKLNYGIVI
jgi:hypothetical protein